MISPPPAVSGSRRVGSRRRAPDLRAITVGEVMHPGVVSCAQTATAAELARMMSSARAHCVAVTGLPHEEDDPARIWGIVSDLDVLRAVVAPGPAATAGELAWQPVITVRPTTSVHEATEAMVSYGAHHLVVAEPDRHTPVGILSTLDVIDILQRAGR